MNLDEEKFRIDHVPREPAHLIFLKLNLKKKKKQFKA